MPDLINKQREIDDNYQAFSQKLPELVKTCEGKFVLMRHRQFIEFFDTARDAILYANKTYDDGLFSVQEVTERTIDLGWFSHAPLHDTV
jgi:hypothetical protein